MHRPMKELRPMPYLIVFSDEDFRGAHHPHDDAFVVSMTIANYNVRRILMDNGSSADILYWDAFKQMGIAKEKLDPAPTPLLGFAGESVLPEGSVTLPVTEGDAPNQ